MLTAVVLAHNEQANLDRCLTSLKFCDHVLVIDDTSTDETVSLAKKYGAKVISHPLSGDFSAQRNFALSHVTSGWVLFVDADEVVTQELSQEVLQAITNSGINGFYIPRRDFLWGHQLRHGDTGSTKLLRLGQVGQGTWTGKVHETWAVQPPVSSLSLPLLHYPHPTIVAFLTDINHYSTIRAKELYDQGKKSSLLGIIFLPVFKFKLLYLIKLGFLDGTAGFVHAMLMAFYTFLVRGKLYLLYKGIS